MRLRLQLPVLCRFLSLYRLRFRCLWLLFLIFLFHFFHFLICLLFHIVFFRIFSFRFLRSLLFHSLRFGIFSFHLFRSLLFLSLRFGIFLFHLFRSLLFLSLRLGIFLFHLFLSLLFLSLRFGIFFFRLFRSLLFLSLLVRRCIHLVRSEQFCVCRRISQQVLDNRKQCFHHVRCHPVETEARRFLALAVEVPEEIVYRISVAVKAQKLLRVFRFRRYPLGITFAVKSGNHADFARLLVADNQHVLFLFLFLFH